MPVCPHCHQFTEANAAFCDLCGKPLSSTPSAISPQYFGGRCPNCDSPIFSGEKVCATCGTPLLPPSTPYLTPAPVYPTPLGLATAITGRLVVQETNVSIPFPPGRKILVIGRADPIRQIFPDVDTTEAGGDINGVSRRHAQITLQGGQLFIEDLGSTNTTQINRRQIFPGQLVPLREGDEVLLGRLLTHYYK